MADTSTYQYGTCLLHTSFHRPTAPVPVSDLSYPGTFGPHTRDLWPQYIGHIRHTHLFAIPHTDTRVHILDVSVLSFQIPFIPTILVTQFVPFSPDLSSNTRSKTGATPVRFALICPCLYILRRYHPFQNVLFYPDISVQKNRTFVTFRT